MFSDWSFIYYGFKKIFFLVCLPFVYLVIILFSLLFPFFPFSENVSKIYVSNVNILLPLAEALLFLLFFFLCKLIITIYFICFVFLFSFTTTT